MEQDLEDTVLTQIGREYPMSDEFETWKEHVEDKLNSMTNTELLYRISEALKPKHP